MKKITELIELVRKSRELCPWCEGQKVDTFIGQVMSEAQELEKAIREKDEEGIKEEMGDLLWDVIMLIHVAEHHGMFSPDEVVEAVSSKMKRRKPYLLEGKKVTLEESWRLWKQEKAREKEALK